MYAVSNHMISINRHEETVIGKHYSLYHHNGNHSQVWSIDFGASQHIGHNLDMFFNKQRGSKYIVNFPIKMVLPVHISGNIKVDHIFVLIDVLYVLNFNLNLILVSSLTKAQKLMIQFTCDHGLSKIPKSRR